MKCPNEHEPGNCPLDTNKNKTTPTCVNCGGNHTANNASECTAFKKAIELTERKKHEPKKIAQNIYTKQTPSNARTTHSKSYASAAKAQPKQNKPNAKQNDVHIDMTYVNEMFSQNQKQMLEMFQQMMKTQNELIKSCIEKYARN